MPTVYNNTLATGGRDTLDLNQSQRKVDMRDKILLLEPDKSPLVVLLSKLRSQKAKSPKIEWMEDVLLPKTTLMAGAASPTQTALTITTGEGFYFKAGDLIQFIRTGEIARITAVATSTLTVTRGFAGAAAAALVSGDEVFNLGNASAENAGAPSMVITQVSNVSNYTQIFRTPFGASRTTQESDLYGGPDRNYLRNKMGIEHLIDIERAFLFGGKVENTTAVSGRPLRATGGLQNFITTNVTTLDSNGIDSVTDIEDFLRTGFRYGSDTKFLLASPLTIQKINELALGKIYVMPKEEVFGLTITQWVSSHGVVNMIKSKLFDGPQTKGMAFLLDLENLAKYFITDTMLRTNIQSNDADGWVDEYLTETGLAVMSEKTHAILRNADGGTF